MKKICFLVFVLVCFAFCINVNADEVVPTNSTIVINGKVAQFSVPTVAVQGRTMVPMREIFEKLGATVEWINDEQRIIAKTATKTIDMQINNNWTSCNNIEIYTDAAPMLYNSRTVVPLRFVGEQLNLNVGWDGNTNTITLDTKGVVTIGTVQKEEVEFHEDYDMAYEVRILKKYTGELVDGVPSGVGSMEYYYYDEKGNINSYYSYKHVGCFSDGTENGFISQVISYEEYANKGYTIKYEDLADFGFYSNGKKDGLSWYTNGYSGVKYTATYNNGIIDENLCIIEFPDGAVYEGSIGSGFDEVTNTWFYDAPHGFGILKYADDVRIVGNWKYGRCDGYCCEYNGEVLRFEGQYKNGLREGYGKLYDTVTGNLSSEGMYTNNQFTGNGILYIPETGVIFYEGSLVDAKPDGFGRAYDNDGRLLYEGYHRNGEFSGYGMLYDEFGNVIYKGNFPIEESDISYNNYYDYEYTPSAIESKIDGKFEGFKYENIYKLTNGQIWMQTSYDYEYHYAYRPDVIIFKDGVNYKMKVEGAKKLVEVKKIK